MQFCTALQAKEIEEAYRAHFYALVQLSAFMSGDEELAFEVVQEVFAAILQKNEPILHLRAYLFQAVKNKTLTALRSKNNFEQLEDWMEATEEEHPSESYNITYTIERLMEAIDALPTRRKSIFLLSRQSRMSYAEIAEVLGISVKTVENQMMSALKQLRKNIPKE